jgi:integrative and conjugative element protein (TIGR02256 family)
MEPRRNLTKFKHRLIIYSAVLEFIEAEARRAVRTETGGVLVGRGDFALGEMIITGASGPGPLARKTKYSFARDTQYCQRYLDKSAKDSSGLVDYVGEWHKHHEIDPRPSWQDITTIRKIASSSYYHVTVPVLLIIGQSNLRESLRAFAVREVGGLMIIEWEPAI